MSLTLLGVSKGAANGSPWSLIAHTTADAATSPSTSAIDTTGANIIFVTTSAYSGNPVGTLSDSKSNTWTAATELSNGNLRLDRYYCINPTVGTGHTFTFTGAAIVASMAVEAWASSSGTPVFDKESGTPSDTGTSATPPSVTPAVNNSLLFCSVSLQGNTSAYSINSGYTIGDSLTGTSNNAVIVAYLAQGTAAAIAPTVSWTTDSFNIIGSTVFKPA